jgi:hypothetical protein
MAMNGSGMAAAVKAAIEAQFTVEDQAISDAMLLAMCNAIVNYIKANAVVSGTSII